MNFRSPHRRVSRIPRLPLVALIDVVLFLLMYFMLATDMGGEERQLAATLKADSKEGGSAGGSSLRPQIVSVEPSPDGFRFRIGDRVAKTRDSLAQILSQLPKDNGVIVRVSPECSVEAAASALQACKDAGFIKVSYVPASE